MLRRVVIVIVLQARAWLAVADLPIHCLSGDVQGSWEFALGPSSEARSSCGHERPDDPMREPLLREWPASSFGGPRLSVELGWGGVADVGGTGGSWTMVSDEALQVNVGDREFLAFFGFQPLPAGDGGEHLPIMLQKRHSLCNETVRGWYRDSSRSSWGCWYGRRVQGGSRSFLQRRNREIAQHGVLASTQQAQRTLQSAPSSLDWRNASGRAWVGKPLQQSMCGGCYAIASTQMLSARHRISKQDPSLPEFSAAFPMYCGEYTEGCSGGFPFLATKWSEDIGLVPETCVPWTAEGSCKLQCQTSDMTPEGRLRAANHRYVKGGEDAMIQELQAGPLAVSFKSDPELLQYTGGVWEPPDLDPDDRGRDGEFIAPTHSALLVGYGEDATSGPYWILQNAWGPAFGEQGGFRIRRDVARSRGIELLVVAADVVADDRPRVLQDFVQSVETDGLSLAALESRRTHTEGHRGTPVCKVAAGGADDQDVIVRIDPDTNFRGLSFGLSAGTETAVQCGGDIPASCKATSPPESLPDCASLDGCDCDLHQQELPFPGMQALAEKVVLMCNSATDDVRVLMIGLGGGAISSYIRDRCPAGRLTLDNVEKDGRVAGLASKFFGFKEGEKNTLQVTDGLSSVLHGSPGAYDAILVDCFAGRDRVPDSCRSPEFVGAARKILKPDGLIAQNIWGRSSASDEVGKDFQAAVASYTQVFGNEPRKEVAFDAPQSLEYIMYGVQGQRWTSMLPAVGE